MVDLVADLPREIEEGEAHDVGRRDGISVYSYGIIRKSIQVLSDLRVKFERDRKSRKCVMHSKHAQ